MYDQLQSDFFRKLPVELRLQIYAECSRPFTAHIYVKQKELRVTACLMTKSHDFRSNDCESRLEETFQNGPPVQKHQQWFDRKTSEWCNHWRCGEAVEGGDSSSVPAVPLSLLLCCRRIHEEVLPILERELSVAVTGREATEALLGLRKRDIASRRGRDLLTHATSLSISLRHGAEDLLFRDGPSMWHALSRARLPHLKSIYLWIDGLDPVARRLHPTFRAVWDVPEDVAARLVVSFPCGSDASWAWGEVPCNSTHPAAVMLSDGSAWQLPIFSPRFEVEWRGWERYTATQHGYIRDNVATGMGGPGDRLVVEYNPFEMVSLYGRGYFDSSYPV